MRYREPSLKWRLSQLFVLLASAPVFSQDPAVIDWQSDIDFVVKSIETLHPNPWDRVDRELLVGRAEDLSGRVGSMIDAEVTVELMRLVAMLRDGHSKLIPVSTRGFKRWYPLRFSWFSDGVYVTAVSPDYRQLAGARLLSIGHKDAVDAANEVTQLFGADNRFGQREFAFLLASIDILSVFGLANEDGSVSLEVLTPDGRLLYERIEAAETEVGIDFRFRGEMFGPSGPDSMSAFEGITGQSLYSLDEANDMPHHLRSRAPYWFVHEPESSLLYFQVNYMTDSHPRTRGSILQLWHEAMLLASENPEDAQRLVIDLRYDFGGDGSLAIEMVNELIRNYPYSDQPGHIFVLTSGTTFSAGVMLASELLRHVPATLVGEPMGAPLNAYGDPETIELPSSGLSLEISRRWWQLSNSDDARRFIPVNLPAPMTGDDYVNRRDPAMHMILSHETPYPTLDRILLDNGADAAQAELSAQMERWGDIDYWEPVVRQTFDDLGDVLLEQGRAEDAVAAFEMNTVLFADDWDSWDDLGAACDDTGDSRCALEAYEMALSINPTNWNRENQREAIVRLRAEIEFGGD